MRNDYFKIAVRKIARNKFFALLNILGLALAFACGLTLFQFISFHTSFDAYHPKAGQLYRIVTDIDFSDGKLQYGPGAPLPAGAAMQQKMPEVKGHAELLYLRDGTVEITGGQQNKLFAEHDNISFTNAQFFQLFSYRFLQGGAASLNQPGTIAVAKSFAEKYFTTSNCIGQTLRLNGQLLTVTAVIADPPANTDIKSRLFVSRASFNQFFPGQENEMMHDWGYINSTTQCYVWLASAMDADKAERALAAMKKDHFDPSTVNAYRFHLQPLKDVHFNVHYGAAIQPALLNILGVTGIFLVLIACFNFINFATAQSTKRAREIGTRKVLGSTPRAIFWQFIAETTLLVSAACVLALLCMVVMRPFLNSWLQVRLPLNVFNNGQLAFCVAAVFVFMVFAGGFYPALVLSRFKPVHALKNNPGTKQAGFFRNGLIVLQNLIVQVLIICVMFTAQQAHYLKSADIGFDKNAVLLVPLPGVEKNQLAQLKQQLNALPQISSVSFCWQAPSSESGLGGSVKIDGQDWTNFACRAMAADSNYLHTFKLQLIAGTNLQESDTVNQFIITELLAHKLGIPDAKNAVGRRLTAGSFNDHQGMIVGVVKDFNSSALYKPLEPVYITTQKSYYKYAAIKLGGNSTAAISAIRAIWANVYPLNVFEYHFTDEQVDGFYHREDLLNKLIDTSAVIAVIISCIGLLGLMSFSVNQRTKEIGIRKVLGAPVSSIVYMLLRSFLTLLLVSAAVSVPLAWYTTQQWLQNFAYHIKIGWWVFAVAIAASVVIGFATTVMQSVKAAVRNPVESLKVE